MLCARSASDSADSFVAVCLACSSAWLTRCLDSPAATAGPCALPVPRLERPLERGGVADERLRSVLVVNSDDCDAERDGPADGGRPDPWRLELLRACRQARLCPRSSARFACRTDCERELPEEGSRSSRRARVVLRYLTSVRPAARSPIEGAPVSGRFDIGTRVACNRQLRNWEGHLTPPPISKTRACIGVGFIRLRATSTSSLTVCKRL